MALSAQEAELYDRQIRLWGVAAQQRMRAAHVLVYGMNALGAEVAKNAVLAGTNLTLGDSRAVETSDLGCNFFIEPGDLGKNRAEASLARLGELNRLVKTSAAVGSLTALPVDVLRQFSVVVICDGTVDEQRSAARLLRSLSVPFMAAGLFGFFAAMVVDLGPAYAFNTERRDRESGDLVVTPNTLVFPTFDEALTTPFAVDPRTFHRSARQYGLLNAWLAYVKGVIGDPVAAGSAVPAAPPAAAAEARRLAAEVVATAGWTPERAPVLVNSAALDAFLSCRGIQIVPVACILGGVIANQLVGILSGRGRPLHNVLFFDSMSSVAAAVHAAGPPRLADASSAAAVAAAPPVVCVEIDDD